MTNTTIKNAPKDLNLTDCYVSNDGGATQTSLSDIKTSADTATSKVAELEEQISKGGSNIDTSSFLTKSNINAANGVVGITPTSTVYFPNNGLDTIIKAGIDVNENAIANFGSTVKLYYSGTAVPYQEIYGKSPDGTAVIKKVWGKAITPTDVNYTTLGSTDKPFKDLFLSNAPTVTSDINTKSVITSDISKSEYAKLLNAVYSVSTNLYSLKIVEEEKGKSDARIHSGFIAQELEAAVKAQGLDPSDFAFWCNSPVYEETKHEIQDEKGDVTYTSTYDLKVDENGQQVYQQSLRYEELFSLLAEAIKVKMVALEERLTALEAK